MSDIRLSLLRKGPDNNPFPPTTRDFASFGYRPIRPSPFTTRRFLTRPMIDQVILLRHWLRSAGEVRLSWDQPQPDHWWQSRVVAGRRRSVPFLGGPSLVGRYSALKSTRREPVAQTSGSLAATRRIPGPRLLWLVWPQSMAWQGARHSTGAPYSHPWLLWDLGTKSLNGRSFWKAL